MIYKAPKSQKELGCTMSNVCSPNVLHITDHVPSGVDCMLETGGPVTGSITLTLDNVAGVGLSTESL